MISNNSVRGGSYALTELTLAEKKWPNPERKVLPVLIEPTDFANIPIYASICNILQPDGNVSARVRIEVNELSKIYLRKKLGQIAIMLLALVLIGGSALFAYREYLDQGPVTARTKLGVMNIAYDKNTFLNSVLRGDLNVVSLFLSAGMNPNVVDKDGTTALMKAIIEDDLDIVKVLVEAKIDVNAKNKFGWTALSGATARGQDATVSVLLDAGANVNKEAFIRVRNLKILAKLMPYITEQSVIDEAFITAASTGKKKLLPVLLDKISDRSKISSDALLKATKLFKQKNDDGLNLNEKSEILMYLLDLGADVNIKDQEGITPLIAVANKGVTKFAKILLEKNADPNTTCRCPGFFGGGQSPLTLVTNKLHFNKSSPFFDLLLASGADVNLAKKDGTTPLMLAVKNKNLVAVKILLEKGAKVNNRSEAGESALSYAAKSGQIDILTALFDNGAVIHTDDNLLLAAVDNKKYDLVKILLKQGIDINKANNKGQTALMNAVQWMDADMVRILLTAGANISEKDKMGRTAMVFATRGKQNSEIIQLLQNAAKQEL